MSNNTRSKKKPIALWLLSILIVSSSFFVLFNPKTAMADNLSTSLLRPGEIPLATKYYAYYWGMKSCLDNGRLDIATATISEEKVSTGNWFKTSGLFAGGGDEITKNPAVGYYLNKPDINAAYPNIIECDAAFISEFTNLFGFSSITDTFCSAGGRRFYDSGALGHATETSDCLNGVGDKFKGVAASGDTDKKLDSNDLLGIVSVRYFDGKYPTGNAPTQNYFNSPGEEKIYRNYLWQTFSKACDLKEVPESAVSSPSFDKNAAEVYIIKNTWAASEPPVTGTSSYSKAHDKWYIIGDTYYYGNPAKNTSIYIQSNSTVRKMECSAMNTLYNGYVWTIYNANLNLISAANDAINAGEPNVEVPDIEDSGLTTITTQTEEDDGSTCNIDGGFGWVICPVLKFMAKIADSAYGFIEKDFLIIGSDLLTKGDAAKTAWQSIQGLANVAFIIAFLIIIFSQVTSVGITNYGIKKMLPKLIVAAILVNLSYIFCQIAVDLSNIVGSNVNNYIASSITITDPTQITTINGTVDLPTAGSGGGMAVLTSTVLVGIGVGALWLSLSALIPMLLGAILSCVMILFILVGRKALIVILTVLSPLAFVAYLLPNTKKVFDMWKKTFMSMLMIYPIVAFVFAGSKLASSILMPQDGTADDTIMMQVIASGVAVIPLFVVPGLLKKSMDGVAGIGNMVNKLSTSASGLAKKGGDGANKLVKKGYDNTAFARGKAMRTTARKTYRDAKFARKLTGTGLSGSIARVTSKTLPMTKGQKYQNADLVRKSKQNANKADLDDIKAQEEIYTEKITNGQMSGTQQKKEFDDAMKNNDTIKARAMINAQIGQGGGGQELALQYVKDFESIDKSDMHKDTQILKTHIATTQPDLDKSNIQLAKWASTSTIKKDVNNNISYDINSTVNNVVENAGTYAMNDAKLIGQSEKTILKAYEKHQLDATRATEMLANTNLTLNMKQPVKDVLARIPSLPPPPPLPPPPAPPTPPPAP